MCLFALFSCYTLLISSLSYCLNLILKFKFWGVSFLIFLIQEVLMGLAILVCEFFSSDISVILTMCIICFQNSQEYGWKMHEHHCTCIKPSHQKIISTSHLQNNFLVLHLLTLMSSSKRRHFLNCNVPGLGFWCRGMGKRLTLVTLSSPFLCTTS